MSEAEMYLWKTWGLLTSILFLTNACILYFFTKISLSGSENSTATNGSKFAVSGFGNVNPKASETKFQCWCEKELMQKMLEKTVKGIPAFDTASPTYLSHFGEREYEGAKEKHPIQEEFCKVLQNTEFLTDVPYMVCAHDPAKDPVISSAVVEKGESWESWLSKLIVKGLRNYGPDGVLIDCGVNIGVHTLYAAASGFRAWGVDPLTTNLVKTYHSLKINNVTGLVRLIRNGIDGDRRNTIINVELGNIGASKMALKRIKTPQPNNSGEALRTILLSDIFEDIATGVKREGRPLSVFLKLDIEAYECRAIMGSKSVFTDPRFKISYIFQEFIYYRDLGADRGIGYVEFCPEEMLKDTIKFLWGQGYKPFQAVNGEPIDPWRMHTLPVDSNVIWIKYDSVRLYQ